jgi:ketosteroid isomerase-like protein
MRTRNLLLGLSVAGIFLPGAEVRTSATSTDEQTIRALDDRYSAAVASKDVKTMMSIYAPSERLVVFDAFLPRQYVGLAAVRKDYEDFFGAFPGPAKSAVSDLNITAAGAMAYAYGVDRWVVTAKDGTTTELVFRFTDVPHKAKGRWLIVHEHISFPVDPATGTADYLSKS